MKNEQGQLKVTDEDGHVLWWIRGHAAVCSKCGGHGSIEHDKTCPQCRGAGLRLAVCHTIVDIITVGIVQYVVDEERRKPRTPQSNREWNEFADGDPYEREH